MRPSNYNSYPWAQPASSEEVAVIVAALGAPTYADDVAARAKRADAE
jgi:hypothetical protein